MSVCMSVYVCMSVCVWVCVYECERERVFVCVCDFHVHTIVLI